MGQCSRKLVCYKPTPGHLFAQKTFAEWAASSLEDGEDSAVDADTDGDRIPNLLEFAFGMDLAKPETTTSSCFSGFFRQNFALTYQVDRAAGGVIVRVEYVELGQEWQDILGSILLTGRNIGNGGHCGDSSDSFPASQKIVAYIYNSVGFTK